MAFTRQQSAGLQTAIFGTRHQALESGASFEECVVHHVDASGIWFTRPDFDNNATMFGPAPFTWESVVLDSGPDSYPQPWDTDVTVCTVPHSHQIPFTINEPQKGDRLLICWLGARQGNPWAIGWWPGGPAGVPT